MLNHALKSHPNVKVHTNYWVLFCKQDGKICEIPE